MYFKKKKTILVWIVYIKRDSASRIWEKVYKMYLKKENNFSVDRIYKTCNFHWTLYVEPLTVASGTLSPPPARKISQELIQATSEKVFELLCSYTFFTFQTKKVIYYRINVQYRDYCQVTRLITASGLKIKLIKNEIDHFFEAYYTFYEVKTWRGYLDKYIFWIWDTL